MSAGASAPLVRSRGSSQGGLRQYNERVVLQAIRLHGALPGAELARLTHLTAQTISLITKRLLEDGLLLRLEPVRGKVGQPSVPLALNPDGAFSIGLKIGRRSLDALLVDFAGHVRERLSLDHAFPDPDRLFADIEACIGRLSDSLEPAWRSRLHGVGVAAPLSLGGWQQLLGIDPALAQRWHGLDIRERVAAMTELPVEFVKDTAAACVAELVAGRGRSIPSFLYVFVDTFIGGGLVIDSQLRSGASGNAGAIGSLPLGLARGPDGRPPAQLLAAASLWTLENRYREAGLDPAAWSDARALAEPWRAVTEAWIAEAAPAIALAVNSAAGLLDVEGVIVDGSFSRELLAALLSGVNGALDIYDWEGLSRPALLPGTIGSDARALGGALLPLYAHFAPDRELFLKLAG